MGGGSLNLEILRGGGFKQFWKSRWEGGSKKPCLPSRGCGFFFGITQCIIKQLLDSFFVIS